MISFIIFPVLAICTVWLLSRWTALRKLPIPVTTVLCISFFIPISTVALVPFDLVNDATVDTRLRLLLWRIIYWVSFLLMWLVLPVMQAYVESGYYTPFEKFKDALKSSITYQLIMLGAGVAGVIYMGLTTGLNFTNLKAVCVALSHSYGLVLVIWMLGHGFVEIPRNLWHSSVKERLAKLYSRAVPIHDQYKDAQSSYDDVVAKIMALEPIKTSRYQGWIDSLVYEIRSQNHPLSRASSSRAQPRDLTPANVSALSRRFHRELSLLNRSDADWKKLLQDIQYYENLKAIEDFYSLHLRRILILGAAVILSSLSVAIAWSEIVSGTKISLVDIAIRNSPSTLKFFLAVLVLGYMCFCVISSLTSMRIFNLYAIVPKQTDESSLLFFAAYALRLTVPLSYNFLILNGTEETVFQEFLGKFINLTALGKYFNLVLPRLIVIPILLTTFNVYEFVKDYLGFGLGLDYFGDAGDAEAQTTLFAAESEGRELVRRALQGFNGNQVLLGRGMRFSEASQEEDSGPVNKLLSWFT